MLVIYGDSNVQSRGVSAKTILQRVAHVGERGEKLCAHHVVYFLQLAVILDVIIMYVIYCLWN